jgi:hypothetical protein
MAPLLRPPFRLASLRRLLLTTATAWPALLGCHPEPKVGAAVPESAQACEARRDRFIAFLQALPERSVAAAGFVDLPLATVGMSPGTGPVLQLSPNQVLLDGQPLRETALDARVRRVSSWLAEKVQAATPGKSALYVAASADLDIHTLRLYLAAVPETLALKLLVRTSATSSGDPARAKPEALQLAHELLAEQNPERRAVRSLKAYRSFSTCTAFDEAVSASPVTPLGQTWQARRSAMIEASSRCHCSELDTDSLQQIASAEQRAGAAGLGALPADFLRDHRCEAAMARRSVGKLVKQMEAFDAEFAGDWQNDALRFQEVLADERLLNYFCNALPGEALAALQRDKSPIYFRPAGAKACQAWRFEPLAPGAPMGTLRRTGSQQSPLAFHYWQAAEELRVFGPVPEDAPTKATDQREWPCEQKYRLVSVDSHSIETETTRWYLDERACLAGPSKDDSAGCFGASAASTAQ